MATYRHFGFEIAEEAQDTPTRETAHFMTGKPHLAQKREAWM